MLGDQPPGSQQLDLALRNRAASEETCSLSCHNVNDDEILITMMILTMVMIVITITVTIIIVSRDNESDT